jgi:hypothetical protein
MFNHYYIYRRYSEDTPNSPLLSRQHVLISEVVQLWNSLFSLSHPLTHPITTTCASRALHLEEGVKRYKDIER